MRNNTFNRVRSQKKILSLPMLQIKYKSVTTPFHDAFITSHGLKTEQAALWIALTFNQVTGYGEAPAIHYYHITVEKMIEDLISKIEILQKYNYTEPERFWHFCHHLFPENNFLVCALDMAYWDMYAKMNRKKIYELLLPSDIIENLDWEKVPMTDFTIGMDTLNKMLEKLKQNPYPIYKIKVGGKEDLKIMQALRKQSNAIFRVDANAGWSLNDALNIIPELAELGIEFIEQPLAKDDFEGMATLKTNSVLPLIADESCVVESDVAKCAPYFDGINIKLTKCGGLTPALRMIKMAKSLNLKVMMGCMNETEIGSYAIAQFLPILDYVDMDGPLLLKIPSLKLIHYHQGKVSFI
jgi:L-alanine-DL-glutamate epimerase-like enolase superfamily enzyme